MQFASFAYLVFLSAVVLAALALPPRGLSKRLLLLLASYGFYGLLDLRFLPVLWGVTAVAYAGGLMIHRAAEAQRKPILVGTLTLLLASLCVFRYVPTLGQSHQALLQGLGLQPDTLLGQWFVPVGLSFYTFVAIGYLVDIYRRKIEPTRDPLTLALFTAFFPQVLSGPIGRAAHLMPQLQALPRASAQQIQDGIALMLRGFAKKLLLADVLGVHIIAPAFDHTASASGLLLLVGLYAYTLQIYFDLSGYTDLARGAGKLLGIELARNFNLPYQARSISEFWTRWHMSMSSFFRDYLYFGLGGSKDGNVYLNLLVTFVAIGIWHGAGWNFAIYGTLHGGLVAFERYCRGNEAALPARAYARIQGVLFTFHFVVLTRVLFREADFPQAVEYLQRLVSPSAWSESAALGPVAWAAMAVGMVLVFLPQRFFGQVAQRYLHAPELAKALAIVLLTYGATALSPNPAAFVYFRF
ncbi:MBOAT family O-acyltransferase [Azohydromonas caseinilytica]|uniref:Probable alginate O-acetylase AlgI n=1 Tax=Azohydromonas caseinilytica TaxID=2728836 RepID=A0A848FE67_9BURK|nr:MBOAT family protein [Azohydromonas caseinilytica]NML16573.1 MBOAT family protein [Azohydromonas caseinilytica]